MKRFGHYDIEGEIGSGGNATVYACSRDGSAGLAIKILKTRKQSSEPWKRFESEISILSELNGTAGVMPLLASGEQEGQLWYTMPRATPLRDALANKSLVEIIEVFRHFAAVLVELSAKDIYHRDIKPENLFHLPDHGYVLGDFGLHEGPQNPAITPDGRRIGPALYAAQEMLAYRNDQDHTRADVFSLAKTLWVVATGQALPMQGQHPADFRGGWIGAYRTDPNTAPLDRILMRATSLLPENRITMGELARELSAWLKPPQPVAGTVDLSHFEGKLANDQRTVVAFYEEKRRLAQDVRTIIESAPAVCSALRDSLQSLRSNGSVNESFSTYYDVVSLLGGIDHETCVQSNPYCVLFQAFAPGGDPPILETAIAGLIVRPKIRLIAGHLLVQGGSQGRRRHVIRKMEATVEPGSMLISETLSQFADELVRNLSIAAEAYANAVHTYAERFK